ncbi:NUDIX domain-containing protein [Iamia majanohamensis]|uniref:NUDIX domain-containing protein n=1 Tax=Iamia majanohamensis TaxID=467976 RepID=A0AAE9Y8T6_9ACTN|nr:NUDIX domain-containing protein [Iamia majanohamensis]WCO66588.1 NUDIX domain-containing protein [Iamia majanohamensis]
MAPPQVDGGDRVPLRDAATVLIVRDGDDGLEVFMLRRNLRSDFVGGAYVFPGGAVDPPDRSLDLERWCEGRSDAEASTRLGVDEGGLAFWVAAIRESFEESGVLLAYGPDGEMVRLDDPATAERFVAHRRAVDDGERSMLSVCEEEDLRLAVDTMWYFGHWITPEGAPRRYDTRFFLAAAPPRQTPVHDDREAIANLWIRPADALARHAAGDLAMLPPTLASLRAIEPSATAAEALAAAAELVDVPTVQPRVVMDEGGVRIVMPGDDEWDDGFQGDGSLGTWPSVDDRSARA